MAEMTVFGGCRLVYHDMTIEVVKDLAGRTHQRIGRRGQVATTGAGVSAPITTQTQPSGIRRCLAGSLDFSAMDILKCYFRLGQNLRGCTAELHREVEARIHLHESVS